MTTTLSASDPRITYSPPNAWVLNSDGSANTFQADAAANLQFDGALIEVFGTIPSKSSKHPAPVSFYTLDDGTPIEYNAAPFTGSKNVPNQQFYRLNPPNGNGTHSLSISLQSGEQLILSSIVFSTLPESNPTSVPSSPTSGFPSSIPSTSPISPSPSPSSTSEALSRADVGGIVGGIMTAVSILAAFVALYLVRRRRKQRAAKRRTVTPFVAEPTYARDSTPGTSPHEKEPLPEVPGPPTPAVRGSMYKKPGPGGLPPIQYGYGGGV